MNTHKNLFTKCWPKIRRNVTYPVVGFNVIFVCEDFCVGCVGCPRIEMTVF